MTLRKLRATRTSQGSFSPERRNTRTLLRRAARGNVHAYVQAATPYVNLVSEYLYLAGITEKVERLFELKQILCDCWRYLPYTRRVSDFERFLQVRLEKVETRKDARFPELHKRFETLSHEGRFLVATRLLNNWTSKALRLSLRTSKEEISRSMMELRCKLIGIDTSKLRPSERFKVLQVSDLLEGCYSDDVCRKIEKGISSHFHAHQFKADWLEYRCELADLQTDMNLSPEESGELAAEITEMIRQQPMEKPRLYDSIVNQFSFVRLPLI